MDADARVVRVVGVDLDHRPVGLHLSLRPHVNLQGNGPVVPIGVQDLGRVALVLDADACRPEGCHASRMSVAPQREQRSVAALPPVGDIQPVDVDGPAQGNVAQRRRGGPELDVVKPIVEHLIRTRVADVQPRTTVLQADRLARIEAHFAGVVDSLQVDQIPPRARPADIVEDVVLAGVRVGAVDDLEENGPSGPVGERERDAAEPNVLPPLRPAHDARLRRVENDRCRARGRALEVQASRLRAETFSAHERQRLPDGVNARPKGDHLRAGSDDVRRARDRCAGIPRPDHRGLEQLRVISHTVTGRRDDQRPPVEGLLIGDVSRGGNTHVGYLSQS